MIEAIYIGGESYYPDFNTKLIKTDTILQVPSYNIDTAKPTGYYTSIAAGSAKIQRYQTVNKKMFLYVNGWWVSLSDVNKYLISGGVIRSLCATIHKALSHFQRLEVA